jgi:hypothetical protein
MSKRTRKGNDRRVSLPLAAMGFGVLLLIGAAVFFSRQYHDDTVIGVALAVVDQQTIDFGHVPDYTEKTFSISVTNTGTGTLRFTEQPYVQVVEGCCPPKLIVGSMMLRPGESTTVTSSVFMMHPGMDGKHDYAVHLKTNDASQPDLVVHVLSEWSQ